MFIPSKMERIFFYIERLELIGFFSAYLPFYLLVYLFSKNFIKDSVSQKRIVHVLPLCYALAGTLYLGLVCRGIYESSSLEVISQSGYKFLKIWGLSAALFWLPVLRNNSLTGLLHNGIIVAYLVYDFFFISTTYRFKEELLNNAKVFFDSILLYTIGFSFMIIIGFVIRKVGGRS